MATDEQKGHDGEAICGACQDRLDAARSKFGRLFDQYMMLMFASLIVCSIIGLLFVMVGETINLWLALTPVGGLVGLHVWYLIRLRCPQCGCPAIFNTQYGLHEGIHFCSQCGFELR